MTSGRRRRQQLQRAINRVDKNRADMVKRAKLKASMNKKRKEAARDGAARFYSDQNSETQDEWYKKPAAKGDWQRLKPNAVPTRECGDDIRVPKERAHE